MSMDGSATSGARRAEQARLKARQLADEASKLERLAQAYEKGDAGERRTARLLDVLDGAGWVVLNDRYKAKGSPANIDHIVVGPPGVCVIDTKNWAARISVDARGFTSNGFRRDAALAQVTEAAALVGASGRQVVPSLITAPVLCFTGEVGLAQPVYEHGVVFLQEDQLLAWLTSLTKNLEPAEVARLGSSLSAHFWPRTEPRSGMSAPRLHTTAPGPKGPGTNSRSMNNRPRPAGSPRRPNGARPVQPKPRTSRPSRNRSSDVGALPRILLVIFLCLYVVPHVAQAVISSAVKAPSTRATTP